MGCATGCAGSCDETGHREYRRQPSSCPAANSLTTAMTAWSDERCGAGNARVPRAPARGRCDGSRAWDTPDAAPARGPPPGVRRPERRPRSASDIRAPALETRPAHRTDRGLLRSPRPHHDSLTLVGHMVNDSRGKPRKHCHHQLVDILHLKVNDPHLVPPRMPRPSGRGGIGLLWSRAGNGVSPPGRKNVHAIG